MLSLTKVGQGPDHLIEIGIELLSSWILESLVLYLNSSVLVLILTVETKLDLLL